MCRIIIKSDCYGVYDREVMNHIYEDIKRVVEEEDPGYVHEDKIELVVGDSITKLKLNIYCGTMVDGETVLRSGIWFDVLTEEDEDYCGDYQLELAEYLYRLINERQILEKDYV